MRKPLSILLAIALTFCSFGTTVNSSSPSASVSTKSGPGVWQKIFLNFSLPSLPGATITGAVLHMKCNTVGGSGISSIVSYVSEDATWDESTSGATIYGLTMLGASTASANVTSTGDKTWDVTGTTNGVKQAYADNKTAVTIRLDGWAGTSTTTNLALKFIDDTGANYCYFDARTDGTPPYLVITYTGGRVRRVGATLNGQS